MCAPLPTETEFITNETDFYYMSLCSFIFEKLFSLNTTNLLITPSLINLIGLLNNDKLG